MPISLRQQIVDILRDAITECRFEPGGRLTERELCKSLGVSRSTVREGLRQLEAEGLIHISPHRGPVIPILGPEEARELYAIRATLDGMASAAVAKNARPETIEELSKAVTEMRAAQQSKDFRRMQSAQTQFYRTLFEASGNRQLAVMLKHLRARMTLLRGLDVFRKLRIDESVRGASEILTAITERDPEKARRASGTHIERAAALALTALSQMTDESH